MSTARLPPALQAFPTLARFPALHPRRLLKVPIGCKAEPSREDLRRSILHIYHDLGVLIFVGCSHMAVQEIGDALRQVVTWGGPGGVVSMLDDRTIKYRREREGRVKGDELYEALGEKRAGIVHTETILRLAKARFKEQLRERVEEMRPAVKDIHIRDVQTWLPGEPAPSGLIHHTVSGPRRLPIESWASLSISRRSGRLIGEIRFFAVGTGQYLGAAQIHYLMFQRDREKDTSAPFWAHGRIPERMMREPQVVRERVDKVLQRVMEPLWRLERETWAPKAAKLVKSRQDAQWESLLGDAPAGAAQVNV